MANNQLATIGNWTPEDMQTMKDTLAVGTNDSQFQLFLRTAHASGLNPFLNHIYAITYQGKMSLQIGIEGIAYLAKQKEGFQGYDAQIVYEGEHFKAIRTKDGVWEIEHEPNVFAGDDAKIVGAYAVAYRDGFKPYAVIMKFSEVEHFQKSSIPNQQTMWKRYTADMFKKHVLKRALKGQFGIDINDDDSIGASTEVPAYEPQRRDITNEVNASTAQSSVSVGEPEPNHQPPDEPKVPTVEELMKQANEKLKTLGITGKAAKQEYIANLVKFKSATPTIAELTGLLKMLEMQIAEKQQQSDMDDLLPE